MSWGFIRRCSDSPPVLLTWKIVTSCSIRVFTASEPSRTSLAATREVAVAAVVVSSRRWGSMCRPKCTMQAKSVNLTKVLFLQSSSSSSPFYDSLQSTRSSAWPWLTHHRCSTRPTPMAKSLAETSSRRSIRLRLPLPRWVADSEYGEATENRQPHCEVRIMFHRVIDQTPFATASPLTHTLDPFSTPTTAPHQAPGHRHDRRRRRRSGEPGFNAHVDAILQRKKEDRGLRFDQVSAIASYSSSIQQLEFSHSFHNSLR